MSYLKIQPKEIISMSVSDNTRVIYLTETQLRTLVKETVEETLLTLGVDVEDPLEMQKDFKMMRDLREGVSTIRRSTIKTIIGVVITGALGLLWLGFRGNVAP